MLLYEPRSEYKEYTKYMPKYTYTPGNNEVVTIRKSWVDNNASYLGVKAGRNTTWHDHLDVGSFIYDNLGVRWAVGLGKDTYSDYNLAEDGKYAFYRNRAEGHNAIVISPDSKVDQNRGQENHCSIDKLEVGDIAFFSTDASGNITSILLMWDGRSGIEDLSNPRFGNATHKDDPSTSWMNTNNKWRKTGVVGGIVERKSGSVLEVSLDAIDTFTGRNAIQRITWGADMTTFLVEYNGKKTTITKGISSNEIVPGDRIAITARGSGQCYVAVIYRR